MEKKITIMFDTRSPKDKVKKELDTMLDEVYASSEKTEEAINNFIVSIFELTKSVNRSVDFNEKADAFKERLLNYDPRSKLAFYVHYSKGVEDAVSDITLLTEENERLRGKKVPNEKSDTKENNLKKPQSKAKGA